MTTITPETAQSALRDALDAYQKVTERITLTSLYLLAASVHSEFPDAQSFVADWSDQGEYLSTGLTVENGPDGTEDYDDLDMYATNLDDRTEALWLPFATAMGDRTCGVYRFNLDRILADVPPLLAD